MIQIDGLRWDVPCQIKRTAEITASEISGLLLDKSYFNDVLGTWMRYEITLAVPMDRVGDFTALYEVLCQPVDGHVFVLPYNEESIQVTGRVENISDTWYRLGGGGSYWEGCSFTLIGNAPTKTMTLNQVITRGRTPLPDVADVAIGTTYTFTENGWQRMEYADGDNISY